MRWSVASKPSPGKGSRCRAGIGCDRLAVVESAPAELDRDQDDPGDQERGEPHVALTRAAHAGDLLANATAAAPASSAKTAESAKDERNARVSTACTSSRRVSRASRTTSSSSAPCSSNGRRQVGDLSFRRLLELPVEVERDRDLGLDRQRRVEDHRRRVDRRAVGGLVELGGEQRRDRQEPDHEAEVPHTDGDDGAAHHLTVIRDGRARERRQREPEPGAGERERRDRVGRVARRQKSERDQATGEQQGAAGEVGGAREAA